VGVVFTFFKLIIILIHDSLDFEMQFPSSALTLLVGRQEGRLACKKLGVRLLVVTI